MYRERKAWPVKCVVNKCCVCLQTQVCIEVGFLHRFALMKRRSTVALTFTLGKRMNPDINNNKGGIKKSRRRGKEKHTSRKE